MVAPAPAPRLNIINEMKSSDPHLSAGVVKYIRSGEPLKLLLENDYNTVHFHGTHQAIAPIIREAEGTLHVYNWSRPMETDSHRSGFGSLVMNDSGLTIRLRGGQTSMSIPTEIPPGYHWLRDVAGTIFGCCNEAQLFFFLDLFHSDSNQLGVFRFAFRQWANTTGISSAWRRMFRENPSLVTMHQSEELTDLFVKVFTDAKGKSATKEVREKAWWDIERAFTEYRKVVAKNVSLVRMLAGIEEPTPELVAERAKMLVKSVEDNPLLSGFAVHDGTVYVVTHPLMHSGGGRRGGSAPGVARMLVSFPVDYKNGQQIYVRSIADDGTVAGYPGQTGSDGATCLGSVYHYADKNIILGEWDMAANLVIRACLGQDRMKSEIARLRASLERVVPDNPPVGESKEVAEAEASGGDSIDVES